MPKRLQPKNFANYEENEAYLDRIFLFAERKPANGEVEIDGKWYILEDDEPIEVCLGGSVSDPSRAIVRSLTNSFEWKTDIRDHQSVGLLFVYKDFVQGSTGDQKHLRFHIWFLKPK